MSASVSSILEYLGLATKTITPLPTAGIQGKVSPTGLSTVQNSSGQQTKNDGTGNAVRVGFDPQEIRCRKEIESWERISKDEGFSNRFKEYVRDVKNGGSSSTLASIINDYRVDPHLTPELHKLGQQLIKNLRLPQPLDFYVRDALDINACCIPSRKGNRLIMRLNSRLIEIFTPQEILFVMGHEVGHALLCHGEIPHILMDNPNFSFLEVHKMRALGRHMEISADRFGYVACQNMQVAGSALFKMQAGLSEKCLSG